MKAFLISLSYARIPVLILLLCVAGTPHRTHAALATSEGYEYAAGSPVVGQSGGTGWANAWQANSSGAGSVYTNVTGSLGYTDSFGNVLVTSSNSALFAGSSSGTGTAQANRDLATPRNSGTTWLSFVGVRVGTTTNTIPDNPYPRGANLGLYNNTSQRVAIGNASGATVNRWSILPLGSTANVQHSTYPFDEQSLVVVRIDHVGTNTNPDNLYVFINPILGVEPDTNAAAISSINVNDYTFNRVLAFAGGYDTANGRPNAEMRIDELRIGDTYADVTPLAFTSPPPHIIAFNLNASTPINNPADLTLNAVDEDDHPLTFMIVSNPTNGSLGALTGNQVTYMPDADFVGFDGFTYQATDGSFTSAVASVSIAITNITVPYPAGPQIVKDGTAIVVTNYATAPLSSRTSGAYPPPINFANQLGRVNFLRSEPPNAPAAASRVWVCDNNRNLYLLNKTSRAFTTFINFEEVFPKFDNDPGYAGGLVSFQFDPDYANNGIFYTVHTEDPAKAGSYEPTNVSLPGFNTNGYTSTAVINPPLGSSFPRQSVLIEWKDSNVANDTFEGTAREILRVGFNSNIHPLGDLLFNPLAEPGHPDYRNLYVANGDGGAGESSSTRAIPQRLDALQGKILRITPDLALRPDDELSANGRYRIPTTGPDPNPFVSLSLANLKKEIFAYGFRNCHRISWDEITDLMFECDIGLHAWEEVNIIHKGGNYGYPEREGAEQLFVGGPNNGRTGSQVNPPVPFPHPDQLVVNGLPNPVTPLYPVAQYSHEDGDAISSGFVYRGSLLPPLYGKYVFGEITTGRIFYCNLEELIAADDGDHTTMATIHELQIVFNGQARRMFDIIAAEYRSRGGNVSGRALPGSAGATAGSDIDGVPYGSGRADIRLGVDGDGELYVMSKSDGMIRKIVSVAVPPSIDSVTFSNGIATLTWQSISNRVYRVQYKDDLSESGWNNLPGDITASGASASKTDSSGFTNRFYRLQMP